MSAAEKYCIHCGAKIDPQDPSQRTVCPSCGKDPDPKEHLFREFLLDHTKDKLKGTIDNKLFDIIKNWLLSHLYGFVMGIAVVSAVAITVNTASASPRVRTLDTEPASVIEAKSPMADEAAGDETAIAGEPDNDAEAETEEAGWWPFGSKRWKTMTRHFEGGSASFTYNYDERGRLTSIDSSYNGRSDTTICECDEDGRWLRQVSPDTSSVYTYDPDGRLISMVYEEHLTEDGGTFDGTDTYTYEYDGSGKIISASTTGRSTSHFSGQPDTIEERTGTETYVYDENDVLQRVLIHIEFKITVEGGQGHAFSEPMDMTEEYGY
ncbi:MAG: hypothetical protein IJM17_00265 [Firmicutes bacterium]|nr:hypothetical protein [Bacillota bacterium]